MENFKLKNILPWGLALPFILIIVFELALSYGLDFYNRSLETKIEKLKQNLVNKEKELGGQLVLTEGYNIFSRTANIVEILKRRPSLILVINKFNQILPNFLVVEKFDFDAEKNEVRLTASVKNWFDYIRFWKYMTQIEDIELKSFVSPKLNEDKLSNFSMVFFLKPSFYQK